METTNKRLLSLDVLRGITVAGMILVNNGGGHDIFAPLKHSDWNGLTPCDLVFPFFLFIMGISTYLSLSKFDFKPSKSAIYKIEKRTLLILVIGWCIGWFDHICEGDFLPFDHLRILGVLTRIGLCYGIVSLIALFINHRFMLWIAAALLILYSIILLTSNGYVHDETNILAIIDRSIFGQAHLYQKNPIDPEGFVSTISAIAHTMIGFYCGKIIVKSKSIDEKVIKLMIFGFIIMSIGLLLTYSLPINKKIWSPSFALTTCGLCSMLQSTLMYFIDIKGKKKWSKFFVVFGVNPLFLYVLSEVLAIVFGNFGIKHMLYNGINTFIGEPYTASAIYAIAFTLMLGAIGYPLYRKRIYIKL